ncbi:msx2-interacting protein isoform X2 [Gadus macrocephalus]|uniref:msx2-interacting protein isoform X2 n=1 Tax=Gadus macrocephalus TaxID=80720 RepID=UPI0028CB4E32|nr:msx2-interacting protein isoform X2 [Gadus macrocephalus]
MVRETRHLWVGNLPEHVREEKIVEHFKRYGRVESVKVLRKRGSEGGVAAFVDFVDIKSAQKAHNAVNKMGDRDLRTDYNEPGSVPSAVRGLEDNPPSSSRDVTGFSRGTVGPVFGPPLSLHTREGRYERRIDGTSETRERAYDHSPYGHHERSGTFDRPRHYNPDYYRDRTMFAATGPGSSAMGPGFEATDPHFESRIRDPFTLTSTARRDLYRDDRGRRVDRTYHHRRSRSSHSSQSRHPSPQRSTGQAPKAPHSPKRAPLSPGRGPHSRSRSRSSSSDSVSSTSSTGSGSSDSNSSSSDGSRARSVQSSAAHAPPQSSMGLDSEEPRRSFGIKVQNLPVRSTDTSLKDGLFHEFKKHGKVTSVQIHGATEDRYGLVFFRQQEDQEKALTVSKGKLFFGMLIEVTAWNGPESENEFRPLDGRIDEFHPKATRTLFIGNLEKTTSYQQLLDIFQRFGEIVDIDIKKVNGVPQYAFVQYSDIASVCKAIKKMDGEYLGSNRLKLGFGKSMPTTCVWLDGLASNITEQYLTRHFCRYGHVVKVLFDRLKGMALILYNNTDFAQAAVRETKGWKIGGNKIKVDFASQESQMAFYRSMQSSGQDIRDFYEIPPERREERRPPYHEFTAERAYYESVRTPGLYPEDARREYPARSRERFPDLEHFPGEPFDPRFHEDPREYRDFRDPFEQDIRKYTYIQRERERERERFEADRGRWSPSHPRRPITPTVSPSPSERAHRDSERRVYSQSSERSGSASSLSPPHFEKSDKTPLEHGSKGDKTDKNATADRLASAEKGKRARRKDKAEKDKGDKPKSRKPKAQSPCDPSLEAEPEAGFDVTSERGTGSVQDATERPKFKVESDPLSSNPLPTVTPAETIKSERTELAVGDSDGDGKSRGKKHIKSESVNDVKELSVDSDRLAARKRRFADASGRPIRHKRSRLDDEDGNHPDISASSASLKDIDGDKQHKDSERRDSRIKIEKHAFLGIQKEGQEEASGPREPSEALVDVLDSKQHQGHNASRRFSHEGHMDQGSTRDPELPGFKYQTDDVEKGTKDREEHVDIDHSQSYRKQMEQNRRLLQQQQQQDFDKSDKPDSPLGGEMDDLDHRSLVHEVGKPPEDVTDTFPSHKVNKKIDPFDNDASIKKERVYRVSRLKTEEPDWSNTASPGFHHSPHHPDEASVEQPQQKEPSISDDKIHSDLELSLKQTHTTQIPHKPNTPSLSIEEEQQKRWESRVKQDILPDLNFSRSISKNIHNRKREDGVWHDLEPGEVRSDSEEDKEHKPHSPMPSPSMPFSERLRVDRISDPKVANLERNKFYSFSKTITSDTQALLDRAKSLSSSRDENWSFLDYESTLAGLPTRKDTEKVESTPLPKPLWYMKKKKIRSGSEDKLDDRKEEPKPEQERRELFASRFLHSSIFEQDSRRLKHLERKHEEPEHGLNAQAAQQGTPDDSEPAVLFRSRFLELTRSQQKGKEQIQPVVKEEENVQKEPKIEKAPEPQPQALPSPKMSEPAVEPEIKPISPTEPRPLPIIISQSTPNEISPIEEKCVVVSPPLEPSAPLSLIKEEKENLEPTHHTPTEVPKDANIQILAIPESSHPVQKVKPSPQEKADIIGDVQPQCMEQPSNSDAQEEFVSCSEPEMDLETSQMDMSDAISPRVPTLVEDMFVSNEVAPQCLKTDDTENTFPVNKMVLPDTDEHEEPTSPPQKEQRGRELKSKKHKQSPVHVSPVAASSASNSEKLATRKSERIDKEKLKRGSSPRGDSSKSGSELKSSAKSPISATDSDSVPDHPPSRTRVRRNVKSVYATPVEDDASVRTGKEIPESPRSGRKRAGDKDATIQHNAEQEPKQETVNRNVQGLSKRGRPRKQTEDGSASKGDRSKSDAKENDSNESESGEKIPKMTKGKHSPSSTKCSSQVSMMSTESKESRKEEKTMLPEEHQEIESMDEEPLALEESSPLKDPLKVNPKKEDQDQQGAENSERPVCKDENAVDKVLEEKTIKKKSASPVSEEKVPFEKDKVAKGKTKLTRAPKSPVLKNLKISLNVTEVKNLLQLGDEENSNQEDPSKKAEGDHTDPPSEPNSSSKVPGDGDGDDAASEKTPQDAAKSFLTQELELAQAVENIAKLTGSALPAKPPTPPIVPPEIKSDPEDHKPSNPASETELMAAIDSITAEDIAAALPPTAPVIDADVDSEPELQVVIPPEKDDETEMETSALPEESLLHTPKKGTKGRPKTPKRSKAQKPVKKDAKERQSVPEESPCPSSDSTASKLKTLPEVTPQPPPPPPPPPPSSATAAVITATTWKPEPESSINKASEDKAKTESSSIEQLPELKSVCPQSKSPIGPKPPQQLPENISPSLSPSPSRPNIRPIQPNRMPVSPPDWHNTPKDIAVALAPVLPATALVNHPNQSLTPEPENMDTDHGTSDLRQILMKPKNMPRQGSSTITSNLPTPRDKPSEPTTQSSAMLNKCPLPDHRMLTPAQPVVRQPASLLSPESKSVISVIASTATSVISRVCNPPETEEKINMTAGNPCVDIAVSKQTYRPSIDDGGSYQGPSVGEEGGSAGRFIVESTNLSTGSSPGLRVNTSEGVVVLSHSGQKIEGPQRISAKISQIPQATAVDIESQQLVSMPQIKQELYSHSQTGAQKGPPILSEHGHSGKTQSASIKQENTGLEKMDSVYQSGPQGVVKRLPPAGGNQQGMNYHHPEYVLMKHQKKVEATDSHSADGAKTSWPSAISPAISPHLPSPPGNHVGFVTSTSGAPSHLGGAKPEPRSPRNPHSPFPKVSSPIGSSSPKGIPVMLPSGIAPMQQYVHHPEQSVIMPPHSSHGGLGRMSPHPSHVSNSMAHLVQDVRVNTPPLSVMNFGLHGEPQGSPWSGSLQQRPTSPQAVSRDMVLKVNPGSVRSHEGEQEEARRFLQMAGRQSVTQLKGESIQAGSLRGGLPLDTYMAPRDMRVHIHQQGERTAPDQHGGHMQDSLPPSSTSSNIPLSLSPRAHVLKGVSEKDVAKSLESKRPHSPHAKDSVMGIRPPGSALASPQRVQLIPPASSGSFNEYAGMYTNPRSIHQQMAETSPAVLNQSPVTIMPAMGTDQQAKQDGKMTQPVNMVQLLTKYPIVWQGLLALKNDTAAVQLHFVCGNKALAHRSLPLQEGGALLRIVQRMRLEASQLESVARRMTGDSDFCLLLALPCGRDQEDVLNQTQALKAAFINYLQAKLAAGIINIPNPGSNQPAYVLQIFPPCEFSESHLSQLAPDLLNRISSISPHLMIVITSV